MTPGQLLMTSANRRRSVLSNSRLSRPLPPGAKNARYIAHAQSLPEVHASAFPSKEPEFMTHAPLEVENIVKLAGATCYRAFLIQAAVSFLSGQDGPYWVR